jgi:hypothetical protein
MICRTRGTNINTTKSVVIRTIPTRRRRAEKGLTATPPPILRDAPWGVL